MNIHEINPYIRYASRSVLKRLHIMPRIIFDYELIYIAEGCMLLRYDGTEYMCETGTVILIHPGIEHSIDADAPLAQPHIHFDLSFSDTSEQIIVSFKDRNAMTKNELQLIRQDKLSGSHTSPILPIADRELFLTNFYEVIEEYLSNGKCSTLIAKAHMIQLINMIIREFYPHCMQGISPRPDLEMQMLKCYIDANCHMNLSLKMLQQQFFYSRSFIEKRFKESYGLPIMQYYTKKRMELAMEMLKTNSVSYVADALSFSSINAFSRAFKNVYGISPARARKHDM